MPTTKPTKKPKPKIEVVDIDALEEHPSNARLHNIEAIGESLTEYGQYQPIVVQKSTMRVIAGNGRLAAARSLDWKKMSAVILDVDDETAKQLLLVDNRTSDLASYDPQALVELLQDVDDLVITGYSTRDIEELLHKLAPPVVFPTVDPGDDEFNTTCPKCSFQFNK